MSLPQNFIEELNHRTRLSELIGGRIKIVKAGREYKGCCPFHNEKTPSFYVNDQKGFYHCFGCGANGDAIKFLMEYEKRPFREAVEILASAAGMPLPEEAPKEKERNSYHQRLYEIIAIASHYFEKALRSKEGADAKAYLENRGLGEKDSAYFNLGYAPQDSFSLLKLLEQKGYHPSEIFESSLFKPSNHPGKKPYPFFRNRIIFPVHDRRGRVVAFGGRILKGDGPKYLNSSDSPIFHKGRLLYNAHRVLEHHKKGHNIIIAEGYMDAITLFKAGFKGAVAPLGTALTEEQIKEAWRLAPENKPPTLCFDGDQAGLKAAFRSLERAFPILEPNKTLKIAFMPEGTDPDELIKNKGKSAMRDVLLQGQNLIDVLWLKHCHGKNFKTPEAKAGLKKALYDEIKMIKDPTIAQLYRDEIWQKFRDNFLSSEKKKSKNKNQNKHNIYPFPRQMRGLLKKENNANKIRSALILATLIHYPELFYEFEERLLNIEFSNQNYRHLAEIICLYLADKQRFNIETDRLDTHLQERKDLKDTLNEILSEKTYIHGAFARANGTIEMARYGLDDILTLIEKERLQKDIQSANERLKNEMNESNLNHFIALKEEPE